MAGELFADKGLYIQLHGQTYTEQSVWMYICLQTMATAPSILPEIRNQELYFNPFLHTRQIS